MHSFEDYKSIVVPIGGRNYILYVADDDDKRRRGLSKISRIGSNEGMIFTYPHPVLHSYTMRETRFPLRIIFIDQNFEIVDEFDAAAGQIEEVRPRSDFKYVIEILGS